MSILCCCCSIPNKASWRKTEPTVIKVLKGIFLRVVGLILYLYIILLFFRLVGDDPLQTVVPGFDYYIPPPYVEFTAPFQYNLTCNFSLQNETSPSCDNYMTPQTFDEDSQTYVSTFFTTDYNSIFSSDGIQEIGFSFYLTNSSKNSIDVFSTLSVALIDHESNVLKKIFANKSYNPDLLVQLIKKNKYVLSPYQVNYIGFKRYENESIADTPKNVFGIPRTDYERDFAIETTFQTSNFPSTNLTNLTNPTDPELLFYTFLDLSLLTYEEPKIGQKKTLDLLGIFSALGGAMSGFSATYVFLFGIERVKPWGFCQRIFRIRDPIQKKLYKTLGPNLPFVNVKVNDDDEKTPVSLEELQKRLNNLEFFLQEYIIDHSYLNEVQKNVEDGKLIV
ncbi:14656_t:CDS:2 [Ambispora leptoticha]|uniref:14656_t:CDS:1 n=1 Tax=Ambispora leptoticha TaxID=144679 RepID=A0A9N9DKS6_9GLOM|nr:14656_t:CDS:2 [Ambispora leptoticha]